MTSSGGTLWGCVGGVRCANPAWLLFLVPARAPCPCRLVFCKDSQRREWADWTADTLIFFLSGAIIASETYDATPELLRPADWGWSVLLWLLLVAIRASMVLLFFPVLSRVG